MSALVISLRLLLLQTLYDGTTAFSSIRIPKPNNLREGSSSRCSLTVILNMKNDMEGDFIDAIIEDEKFDGRQSNSTGDNVKTTLKVKTRKRDIFKSFLRNLASLSLEDYKWRSSMFKSNEADRMMEQSLARMRGKEASYVRPMDASEGKIGPLGKAERDAVAWLQSVIEEEAQRARKITETEGDLVRPMDSGTGPLSDLEKQAVSFIKQIVESETERVSSGKFRPMELETSKRGPLGEAEAKAVSTLRQIAESEKTRMQQSRVRGGDVVRPMDVPGPIGEMEKAIMDIVTAEKRRAQERENQGKIVRPKDSSITGPLGQAERDAVQAIDMLRTEERERLKSIQTLLEDNRPMDVSRESALGVAEAVVVGMLRAPRLISKVVDRVKELLQSEKLSKDDKDQILSLPATNATKTESKE